MFRLARGIHEGRRRRPGGLQRGQRGGRGRLPRGRIAFLAIPRIVGQVLARMPISSPRPQPSSRRTARREGTRNRKSIALTNFRLFNYIQSDADLIHSFSSNIWSIFLIVLFFGGSVFVHELGHFLAARARGVHVEVFSIGFGPPIFSWKSADGTRYQVAWFPLGGFVLLPQIADLGPLEGESEVDPDKLAPVSYSTKMLVFAAGAAFNILFAFILACVIYKIGQPETNESTSTQIGYVTRTIDLTDGTKVTSPAMEAGLRVGDVVKAIDGNPVADWGELNNALVMGSGHDSSGQPLTVFTIEREGKRMDVTLHPATLRRRPLAPRRNHARLRPDRGYRPEGSAMAKAGLAHGDRILTLNGSRS